MHTPLINHVKKINSLGASAKEFGVDAMKGTDVALLVGTVAFGALTCQLLELLGFTVRWEVYLAAAILGLVHFLVRLLRRAIDKLWN